MRIQLIATDIDGTLMNHQHHLDSSRFQVVMRALKKRKVPFVVASGNQLGHLKALFPENPEIIYVADNGAHIADTKRTYQFKTFTKAQTRKILDTLRSFSGLSVTLCTQGAAYINADAPAGSIDVMRHYCPVLQVVSRLDAVVVPIDKVGISCPPDATAGLVATLQHACGDFAHVTSSGFGTIDMVVHGVNKATALAMLGQQLAIPLASMAAFGDGDNDLEMLKAVGVGVAMGNATEQVLGISDVVAPTCDEQGVLVMLEQWLADARKDLRWIG